MDRLVDVGSDAQPMGYPAHGGRIVGGISGRGGHRNVRRRTRLGRRRINPLPVGPNRVVRHQTDARPHFAGSRPSRCLEWSDRLRTTRSKRARRGGVSRRQFTRATKRRVSRGARRAARTPADRGLVQAAARVARTSRAQPKGSDRRDRGQREAIEETAALLRSLGHHVFEEEVDYGQNALANVTVRYLKGAHQDVATMARPERLERNTRRVAALGSWLPTPGWRWRAGRNLRSRRA
jgi:hypothetical protein